MARKQSKEIIRITYTEILTLAIKQLTAEIDAYRQKFGSNEALVADMVAPLTSKRDILAYYYRNETGTDYGLDDDAEG